MNLRSGMDLRPYEIAALLRDTRLGSPVAIRTLSSESGNDARLKIRFEREAKKTFIQSAPRK